VRRKVVVRREVVVRRKVVVRREVVVRRKVVVRRTRVPGVKTPGYTSEAPSGLNRIASPSAAGVGTIAVWIPRRSHSPFR